MSTPLVSFVIPVLNAEGDIGRCLTSIKNLTWEGQAYEIVVMDNGSKDNTQQIVKGLGFSCHVVSGVKVGELRNRGARIARGDYLAFVDADVEVMPGWLCNGLVAFHDEQVVACGCFPGVPKDATWVQQTWDIHQRDRQDKPQRRSVAWLPSMNLLVRRSTFITVGGFNAQLTTAEDVDLCYRLGQLGTILNNPGMEAVHWGEAPDLRTFWRKEVWRGTGNLSGVLSHGLRWDELPSLGYPLYILGLLLFTSVAGILDLWYWQVLLVPLAFGFLLLPALLLAIATCYQVGQFRTFLQLVLLYLIYGVARAFSVMKSITAHQK